MMAARSKTKRIHIYLGPGGVSLCTAQGSRQPLRATEDLAYIPIGPALFEDPNLCSTCRHEYDLRKPRPTAEDIKAKKAKGTKKARK